MPSFDFTAGTMPNGASVSRASVGTAIQSNGLIASIGANLPRFDWPPANGGLKGLLLETVSANVVSYSEQFDNAAWTKSGTASIAANASTAPDGTTAADRFSCGSTAGSEVFRSSISVSASSYTLSVFAKNVAANFVVLQVGDVGGSYARRWFNLSAGVIGGSRGGGANIAFVSAGITSYGNGWYRCSITATFAAGSTAFAELFESKTDTTFDGDATSTVDIWGAQFESGTSPSSYIPAGSVAATRAADSLVLNWASLGAADGACYARITYDDLSSSIIAGTVSSGSQTIAAASLARQWVRKVDYLAVPTVPPIRSATLKDPA